jgi:DNA-binding NarL/FixJ family response regulator
MSRAADYLAQLGEHINAYLDTTEHTEGLPLLDQALLALAALRDRELLDAIAHGDRQADIADALGISHQAVSQQIRSARAREKQRRELRQRART